MHQIGQSRGFLGSLLGPLLKAGFPLTENVLLCHCTNAPLAKSVLIPLRLTAAASATDAGIPKNILDLVWQH